MSTRSTAHRVMNVIAPARPANGRRLWIAALWGACFGPIGTGVYFRSVIEGFALLGPLLLVTSIFPQIPLYAVQVGCAAWAVLRVIIDGS
jgi:hypothetical protein